MVRFFAALLLLISASITAQSKEQGFVLDATKPYVYLAFDHVGPRTPLEPNEPSQGIWLRIVNNCKLTISVQTIKVSAAETGSVVADEIVPVRSFIITSSVPLRRGFAEPAEKKPDSQNPYKRQAKMTMPRGYESSDMIFFQSVLPGQSFLVNVPRSHVSADWSMRIKVFLQTGTPLAGEGPPTELNFFESEIQELAR